MKKDKITFRQTAVVVAIMMSMTAYGQADTLSKDTTLWYNQTQQQELHFYINIFSLYSSMSVLCLLPISTFSGYSAPK
jgi:hypothetical protein